MRKFLVAGMLLVGCVSFVASPALAGLSIAVYQVKNLNDPKTYAPLDITVNIGPLVEVAIKNKGKDTVLIDWSKSRFTNSIGEIEELKSINIDTGAFKTGLTVIPPEARTTETLIFPWQITGGNFKPMLPTYWIEAKSTHYGDYKTTMALLLPLQINGKEKFVNFKFTYALKEGPDEDKL